MKTKQTRQEQIRHARIDLGQARHAAEFHERRRVEYEARSKAGGSADYTRYLPKIRASSEARDEALDAARKAQARLDALGASDPKSVAAMRHMV